MILLDTNVISETFRKRPNAAVLAWLDAMDASALYLSTITLGELARGALKLDDGPRRARCLAWIEKDLVQRFSGRIAAFDLAASARWGAILAEGDRTGRPRPAIDAQIAAVAQSRNLALATRNTRDFDGLDLALIDPFA